MYKVKFFRGNLLVRMPLKRPILDVQTFVPRFNELIYAALVPVFPVTPADFSINSGARLSDIWAKFNLYAGPNSVTLFTDRLAFEFVNLFLQDYPLIYDLLHRVHDEFPVRFESYDYERVEAQSLVHFELLPPAEATQYLKRFELQEHLGSFSTVGSFVEEPGARISVMAADNSWRSRIVVERSLGVANGVYLDVNTILNNGSKDVSFDEKLKLALGIGNAWLRTLSLESTDA
jgi:hypothetical protein